MEQLNALLKIFNILFPFSDYLYILQQEEYDNLRLLRWLPRFFFRRNIQIRERLKYTKRIKLTFGAILILWFLSLILIGVLSKSVLIFVVVFFIFMILVPFFVLAGNFLVSPYFEWVKKRIRDKAARMVEANSNLKIINIAGSYGKTTTKNFIYQLIRYNYRTQMILGNINTPNGIADWVNQNLRLNTEVLVSELDGYSLGEIAKSSKIIPADIAVLTNVGDQHLERFKSLANLRRALVEVVLWAKSDAILITDKETKSEINDSVKNTTLVIKKDKEIVYKNKVLKVDDLSSSNKINLRFALKVAEVLDIPFRIVVNNVNKLELPERRQRLSDMYGYQAIDDSYNISFNTAMAGIEEAKKQAKKNKKKLLVLTAGIPELSSENKDKNKKLGRVLTREADHVIVLGSIFAQDLISDSDIKKVTRVKSLQTFLTETKDLFPPKKWFLLHQPELGDLYY